MANLPTEASVIDAQVRRVVFDSFIERATSISKTEIAAQLPLDIEQVSASFARLAEAHMLVLQPGSGQVLMAGPFSAVPTAFQARSGATEWWGNCIWDALGILAMVARDGTVSSSCPDCGESLRLAVVSGELANTEGVVHFGVPPSRWWDDVVFT